MPASFQVAEQALCITLPGTTVIRMPDSTGQVSLLRPKVPCSHTTENVTGSSARPSPVLALLHLSGIGSSAECSASLGTGRLLGWLSSFSLLRHIRLPECLSAAEGQLQKEGMATILVPEGWAR